MTITRRSLLLGAAAIAGLSASTAHSSGGIARAAEGGFPFKLSDDEWHIRLTGAEYDVLRRHGTEPAFSSPLYYEKRAGIFACAGCTQPLFSSDAKYESGTGWPSFFDVLDGAVATSEDDSHLMKRTEVHCTNCGGHLGHVFEDGPEPTGLRYCINGTALDFVPA
jgi:peptide-methionine (R)-S-oxide reductase